jgi:hypothetical protein
VIIRGLNGSRRYATSGDDDNDDDDDHGVAVSNRCTRLPR